MKKDTIVINQLNSKQRKIKGETFTLPSVTIPGETYTIKDLVTRASLGLNEEIQKTPIWGEDPTHEDIDLQQFHNLDPIEQKEIKDERLQRLKKLTAKQKQKMADEASKKAEEAIKQKNNTTPPQHTQNTTQTNKDARAAIPADYSEKRE